MRTRQRSIIAVDSFGNILRRDGDGIWLKLKRRPEERAKKIAKIDEENSTVSVKRYYAQKHFYEEINGFGFNVELLKHIMENYNYLRLWTDIGNTYLIPVGIFRDINIYRTYSDKGYEPQKFVSVETFEPYKV